MPNFHVGLIIKKQRKKLKITQQQLCEGICEPSTMCKIENGTHNPNRSTLLALLGRVGISSDRFYGLHNFDELEKEDLKQQIKSANYRNEYVKAINLVNELEQKCDCSDNITKQFILYAKAINGTIMQGKVVPYSSEEKKQMLLTAIKYTVPLYDNSNIMSLFLAVDEILIIVAIANIHLNDNDFVNAITIYSQLLNYVQTHMLPVTESGLLVPLITANYSTALGKTMQNDEELKVIDIGIQSCIEHGKSRLLGTLLINKACVLHRLNRGEEGRSCAIRSYYILSALQRNSSAEMVKKYLQDTYQYKVD